MLEGILFMVKHGSQNNLTIPMRIALTCQLPLGFQGQSGISMLRKLPRTMKDIDLTTASTTIDGAAMSTPIMSWGTPVQMPYPRS